MGASSKTTTRTQDAAEASPHHESAQAVGDGSNAVLLPMNMAFVVGQVVGEPQLRALPSGSTAFSFSLTVRIPGEKATSVPAVWYDPPKRACRWVAGDEVVVQGAVVRRFFRGGSGLGSSTEVVVERGELTRHPAKAAVVRQRTERSLAADETSG